MPRRIKTTTISVKLDDADLAKLDQLVACGLKADVDSKLRPGMWTWTRPGRSATLRALIRSMPIAQAKKIAKE